MGTENENVIENENDKNQYSKNDKEIKSKEGYGKSSKPLKKSEFYKSFKEIYEGDFVNGLKNGHGIYFYENGDRYDGSWKDDLWDGKGTLYKSDNSKFIGNFLKGEKNGEGKQITKNGEIFFEYWEKGKQKLSSKNPLEIQNYKNKKRENDTNIDKNKNINNFINNRETHEKMELSKRFNEGEKKGMNVNSNINSGYNYLSIAKSFKDVLKLNIKKDSNIPHQPDISQWDINEVIQFFNLINKPQYINKIKQLEIDGKKLINFNESNIKKIFEIDNKDEIDYILNGLKLFKGYKGVNSINENDEFKEQEIEGFYSIRKQNKRSEKDILDFDQEKYSVMKESNKKFPLDNSLKNKNKENKVINLLKWSSESSKSDEPKQNNSFSDEPKQNYSFSYKEIITENKLKENELNKNKPGTHKNLNEIVNKLTNNDDYPSLNISNEGNENSRDDDDDSHSESEIKSRTEKFYSFVTITGLNYFINYEDLVYNQVAFDRGGFSYVYSGKWKGVDVAIKQLKLIKKEKKEDDKEENFNSFKLFLNEIDIISKLRHPNILLYMGVSVHNDDYFMITEYVQNESLFKLLREKKKNNKKLSKILMLKIAYELAIAIKYLHYKHIIHCDLKSMNVFIDENYHVKLGDFGLSKFSIGVLKLDFIVGTPSWMAPENLLYREYSFASDVFSYGLILTELVTYQTPMCNKGKDDLKNFYEKKEKIETPDSGIPEFNAIMDKCLLYDPKTRIGMQDVVDQIGKIISSQKTKTVPQRRNYTKIFKDSFL